MRPSTRALPLFIAVLCCGVLASNARAEWPHDYRSPRVLMPSTGASQQSIDAAVEDGNGGAFVVFTDNRGGTSRPYAHHMLASGVMDPAWPNNGLLLSPVATSPSYLRAAADGQGGFWASWVDAHLGNDVNHVQRVRANGTLAVGFPAAGVPTNGGLGAHPQRGLSMAVEPGGSLIAVFEHDFSPGDPDIASVRISPAGVVVWTSTVDATGAVEIKPDMAIDADPGSTTFDVVYDVGSTVRWRRFQLGNGSEVPSSLIELTALGDSATGAQVAQDGSGGMIVIYPFQGSGGTVPAQAHISRGVQFGSFGPLTSGQPGPLVINDLVYCGAGQAWYSYGWPVLGGNFLQMMSHTGAFGGAALGDIGAKPSAQILSDGQGGVLGAVNEQRASEILVNTTRRNSARLLPGFWASATNTLFAQSITNHTAACTDGNSGMFVFGKETTALPSLAFAMHVDRWGALDGSPVITSVKDVANDQGGFARVSWKASYLDRELDFEVGSYRVWRQVPVSGLAAARAVAAHDPESPDAPAIGSIWYGDKPASATAATFAWELVATQPAAQLAQYSMTVPSVADSSSRGVANTLYMVEARATTKPVGFTSLPDSGHSVDNLPPATPAPFVGAVVGGANTQLSWGPNTESDLAGYELYRGATANFVPSALNRIATPSLNSYFDSSVGEYYKLAAIDTHGNRSGFALLTPNGLLDAGDSAPHELAFSLASSNPARGGALLRYAMPVAGRVRVQLLDVNGRIVRTLLDASVSAGTYSARWDGRDASGARSAAGMYFARLEAQGRTLTQRIVLAD